MTVLLVNYRHVVLLLYSRAPAISYLFGGEDWVLLVLVALLVVLGGGASEPVLVLDALAAFQGYSSDVVVVV